jgi:hypothetical protein
MDRSDVGEMGEMGGVGGNKNVSPIGIVVDRRPTLTIFCACDPPGVEGGVRILPERTCSTNSWVGGDLYVIPMALWRPTRSCFWGMKATVTSPFPPPSCKGGTGIRTTDCFPVIRGSSHRSIVRIFFLSKYFQLLINRADAGSARMSVFPLAGSWRSVASLQWSGLC